MSIQNLLVRRAYSRPETEHEAAVRRAHTLDAPKLSAAQMAKSKAKAASIFERMELMRAAKTAPVEAVEALELCL
jgi:hypothetical protein